MIDIESTQNKILYLMSTDDGCVRKAYQNKIFLNLFQNDGVSALAATTFIKWFKKYETVPSMQKIYEAYRESNTGAQLKIKFKVVNSLGKGEKAPTPNEFGALVDELKLSYAKGRFSDHLKNYSEINSGSMDTPEKFSSTVKDFGKEFINIGNEVVEEMEGEYSYTTHDVSKNMEGIKNRDISKEKRFYIGHKNIDNELNGFKYGDLLLILGNINAGKSMALTNVAYNLWKNGANVLILTAEMRPSHFDDRIYSRAAGVSYKSVMDGKDALKQDDLNALDECIKYMSSKENHIVTKFLNPTDNVASVEGYVNDLKISRNFVPDVVIFDSLEHISPLNTPQEEKDWQNKGQIVVEFKNWAETALNGRGIFVISTHQAKTEAHNKKFEDISLTDFGRSKIVPEKADFAMYIRSLTAGNEFNTMNVKLIKARRCQAGLTWSMATDYSICLIAESEDSTRSESFIDDDD